MGRGRSEPSRTGVTCSFGGWTTSRRCKEASATRRLRSGRLADFDDALERLREQADVRRELGDQELVVRSLLTRASLLNKQPQRTADAILVVREAPEVSQP